MILKYRNDLSGSSVFRVRTKANETSSAVADTSVTYGGIQLSAESIQYGTGPFGISKPCIHLATTTELHDIGPQQAAVAHNVTPYSYPLGLTIGQAVCGQEYTNQWAQYIPDWVTRVYPYSNGWTPAVDHFHLLDGYDPSADIDTCIRRIISPKVDLPLFLLEISDLRNLVREWNPAKVSKLLSSLNIKGDKHLSVRDVVRGLSRLRNSAKNTSLKDVLAGSKTASNYYLSYMFGIKPLVRDLRSMVSLLSSLQERSAQFRNAGTRIKSSSVRVNHTVTMPADVLDVIKTASIPGVKTSWGVLSNVGTCTVRYRETIPALDGFEAALEQFTRDFGIRLNARTIWDHIPFSFVLDWCLRVGDYISGVEARFRDGGRFELLEATYSLKLEYQRFLESRVSGSEATGHPYYGPRPYLLQASESIKFYERRVVPISDLTTVYAGGGFDSTRISLATALAIQRIRRRGRSRGVSAKAARGLRQIDRRLANFENLYLK